MKRNRIAVAMQMFLHRQKKKLLAADMKNTLLIVLFGILFLLSCTSNSSKDDSNNKSSNFCSNEKCIDKSKRMNTDFSCKLTSPELQKRKVTVLESLRKQIIDRKELPNGYAFQFKGSDKMIDELTTFAKTERKCCDFFKFNLTITGDTSSVWFEITGEKEAKQFIKTELEL
jgi:hypothetical protein